MIYYLYKMKDSLKVIGKHTNGNLGFTFIELLVVLGRVSVMTVVVTLNLPAFSKAQERASCLGEADIVQIAVDAFMAIYEIEILNESTTIGPGSTGDNTWPITDGAKT
jgi:competence protein ComGC